MKKLFRIFKISRSARNILAFNKATSFDEKLNIKTETKTFLRMPMAFDFIAYYDDYELENSEENILHENPSEDSNTEIFYMNDAKCNQKLYSSSINQFECCIN